MNFQPPQQQQQLQQIQQQQAPPAYKKQQQAPPAYQQQQQQQQQPTYFQNMSAYGNQAFQNAKIGYEANKPKLLFVVFLICCIAMLIVVILIAAAPDVMKLNDETKGWGLGVSLVALSLVALGTGVSGYKVYKK